MCDLIKDRGMGCDDSRPWIILSWSDEIGHTTCSKTEAEAMLTMQTSSRSSPIQGTGYSGT